MNFEEALALGKSRSDCAPENLDSLVALIRELDAHGVAGDIVECGSYRCGATIAMAAAAPQRVIYACDLFGGLPYGPGRGFENFADVDMRDIVRVTAALGNIVLLRGRHEETVTMLQGRYALVFLDSDFYESHLACLQSLWPRLSPGGVIVFHDPGFPEVRRALVDLNLYPTVDVSGSPNMQMLRKAKFDLIITDHESRITEHV